MGKEQRGHLQHGTPAPTNTSGDITVVFSPRIANVTDRRQMKVTIRIFRCIYKHAVKYHFVTFQNQFSYSVKSEQHHSKKPLLTMY